jgi:Ser/Thr protein kinase RdoA (MazF antagonist)
VLVATDPEAQYCDVPALLMTRLPGRPRQHPVDRDRFLDELAAQLPPVHETSVRASGTFPEYRPYYQNRHFSPPPWTTRPQAWELAIERHRRPPPRHRSVLIHRDYHAGNVLWRRLAVSGVIDWAWSCRGPAAVDVAHCRLNLVLRLGTDAAEHFLGCWQMHSGTPSYDPTWDLIDAVDALPDLHDSRAALERLDRFVAEAAASTS